MLLNERLPCVGAVLAGGQSRRMGSPKEAVRLPGGAFMIEPVLRAMQGCCSTVVVVGACDGYDLSGWQNVLHVTDLRPGLGPLSGIEALLASRLGEGYVVAACDQPGLTSALLSRLEGDSNGCFFEGASAPCVQPLPGYYPAAWLPAARRAIEAGRLSLRSLVESQEIVRVPLFLGEEELLQSLNTPQEVERFRRGCG